MTPTHDGVGFVVSQSCNCVIVAVPRLGGLCSSESECKCSARARATPRFVQCALRACACIACTPRPARRAGPASGATQPFGWCCTMQG